MRKVATIDAELQALAADALTEQRRDLIGLLLDLPVAIERYKSDAAEAARYGLRVPFTDTMREAMSAATDAIVELNSNAGEWSR